MEHPFFRRGPPKSTGRDTFGEAWVDRFVERAATRGVTRPDDLLATGVEFVARHVAAAIADFAPAGLGTPRRLVVAGGGARNLALLEALARAQPLPVASAAEFGVDPDAREALVFAVLAARCALGIPSTRAAVTGAAPGRVLGKLSQGAAP